MSVRILVGDCRTVMASMEEASVDAVVTDPPYDLTTGKGAGGFMGQKWDGTGVAFDPATWAAVRRVLKPGGHLVAFGGTRTSHRLVCAVEDAGFEIRDQLVWLFGSGFPKSKSMRDIGRPELGTALKPAYEPILLARKPLSERTVAANVLRHGTGAVNVDACRIGTTVETWPASRSYSKSNMALSGKGHADLGANPVTQPTGTEPAGRWPANVLLSHAEGCREVGTRKVRTGIHVGHNRAGSERFSGNYGTGMLDAGTDCGHANPDGTETIPAWECSAECPVRMLDEQSGDRRGAAALATSPNGVGTFIHMYGMRGRKDESPFYGDRGGASRFYFTSKASTAERNRGLNGRNPHPTVKPVDLMAWLCRLVTPPGGVILDPFCGSGSTLVAAQGCGFASVGIEQSPEYAEVARQRVGLLAELTVHPAAEVG